MVKIRQVFSFYSYFLIVCVYVFSGGAQANSQLSCVYGNPNVNQIAQQVAKPENVIDNSFLVTWKKDKNGENCDPPPHTSNFGLLTQLMKSVTPEWMRPHPGRIKRACIAASMKRLESISGRHSYCTDDASKPIVNGQGGSRSACITNDMIDYVHWGVNKAIACINNFTDSTLDAKVVFRKLNNESAFGFFIDGDGGNGIGQLTSPAVRELSPPYKGNQLITEILRSEDPSCQPFRDILQKELIFSKRRNCAWDAKGETWTGKDCGQSFSSAANTCQMISAGDGVGRNLILSLALYVHYRERIDYPGMRSALYQVRTEKVRSDAIVDDLTLMYYNGVEGYDSVVARWKQVARSKNLKTPIEKRTAFRSDSGYLKAIDNKVKEVLTIIDPKKKEFTREELDGAPCVEE